MRYSSFRIRNFKGIKDTTVNFSTIGGASVFAFVGLNESGKTTVLEAIHSFSPDKATSRLVGGDEQTGIPYNERVPRHLISSFTGDVSVVATVSVTEDDKAHFAKILHDEHRLLIDLEVFPSELEFERRQEFKDGDFVRAIFTLRTELKIKSLKQKRWRLPTNVEERKLIRDTIYSLTPDISYFPTFVFDFPASFFLTKRGGAIDDFYRSVFQDILDYDGRGHTIAKDIVRRVRSDDLITAWLSFLSLWSERDDANKIQHVLDRAGAVVTNVVFGRWNKIFGEDTHGKEIQITPNIVEGEITDAQGKKTKTQEHDISVKFQIKDGTRRFDVNDRSLGFRWFFAFMLFTQFRVARSKTRPLLFLFDEPASNLHAAAQQKLVDCFPEIARGEHALVYTTHSHYMIEPKWLEQTFIVTNRADAPKDSILDEASLDDESLDIKVATYRSFVNRHPGQTSYFQPVLDRLNVVPSKFDIKRNSVILEGKSDYYILRYAARLLGREIALFPGLGAGTFGALVSLHLGWGVDCLFILDGDRQGKAERSRYVKEYGISPSRMFTIDELIEGATVVEDLIAPNATEIIQKELKLTTPPNKSQLLRFFQERLAGENVVPLGDAFERHARSLLDAIEQRQKLLSGALGEVAKACCVV